MTIDFCRTLVSAVQLFCCFKSDVISFIIPCIAMSIDLQCFPSAVRITTVIHRISMLVDIV